MKAWREQIIGLIDLTSLNDADTEADIIALCQRAQTPYGHVAAVCIYPQFVAVAKAALAKQGADIPVATVVNFPHGRSDIKTVVAEAQAALADGADEIDMVIPYHHVQQGNLQSTTDMVRAVKAVCGAKHLKVILEAGALNPQQIRQAADAAIAAGADFLKTSTGKIATGATLPAAEIMLTTIREHHQQSGRWLGFKAAGGIRTTEQANAFLKRAEQICGKAYLTAETFRFGASSLLAEVLKG